MKLREFQLIEHICYFSNNHGYLSWKVSNICLKSMFVKVKLHAWQFLPIEVKKSLNGKEIEEKGEIISMQYYLRWGHTFINSKQWVKQREFDYENNLSKM